MYRSTVVMFALNQRLIHVYFSTFFLLLFISPDLCIKVLRQDCNTPGASKVVKW